MANEEHVAKLKKGVAAWNAWRKENPGIRPDLRSANLGGADLSKADLSKADLSKADLSKADLTGSDLTVADLIQANLIQANLTRAKLSSANLDGADLTQANLSGANLRAAYLWGANLRHADLGEANLSAAALSRVNLTLANLTGADLSGASLFDACLVMAGLNRANLSGADLTRADLTVAHLIDARLLTADLSKADLSRANLSGADLSEANLQTATLVETVLRGADLTGCRIYGVSAWGLKLERTKQQNLVLTHKDEPTVTVDNIEVAQFVYLLLHNEKIRDVIDTIGKKGVLLLGRFTEGRMEVLKRLREKLRDLGYVPIVFNFDKPETKNFTETVRLLCNLSHFVVVDITNPRSAPLELQATVPDYMVPFVPILQQGEEPFSMFVDLQNKYDWVLKPVLRYSSVDRLMEVLEDKVVRRAEAKFNKLLARRTKKLRVENV
jgi:uncharacterized protein YjbI with pentapeptide repeats